MKEYLEHICTQHRRSMTTFFKLQEDETKTCEHDVLQALLSSVAIVAGKKDDDHDHIKFIEIAVRWNNTKIARNLLFDPLTIPQFFKCPACIAPVIYLYIYIYIHIFIFIFIYLYIHIFILYNKIYF